MSLDSTVSRPAPSSSAQALTDTKQAVKTSFTILAKEGLNQISGQLKSYKDESNRITSSAGKVAHFAVTALIRAPLWAIGGLLKAPGIGITTLATLAIGTPCHYLTILLQKSEHKTAANIVEGLGRLAISLVGIGPTAITMLASLGQTLGTTNFQHQRDFSDAFNRAFNQSYCLSNIFNAQARSFNTNSVSRHLNMISKQIVKQKLYDGGNRILNGDSEHAGRPKTLLDGMSTQMFVQELLAHCSNPDTREANRNIIKDNFSTFSIKIPGLQNEFNQAFEIQYPLSQEKVMDS